MWVLECDGDLFNRKKVWLRPGKTFIFGRTKDYEEGGKSPQKRRTLGLFRISNKSVSRKHLIITVSPVKPGDGTKTAKSHLLISDESKIGTYLDGEKFTKESRSLTQDAHQIKLGSWDQTFTIKWRPATLTFSSDKPTKDRNKAFEPFRERLEQLDVKILEPFLVGSTTHVVASKRNTAKGLQALINGKHIVTEAYIEAIVSAAVSPGVEEDRETPRPAPLEADFEAAWPDPARYLPEAGKEPNPRPAEYFRPNPERANIFEGFTFIFGDAKQYNSLAGPTNNGGAKSLLYDVDMGVTRVADFVAFVKKSNQKNSGDSFNAGIGKGPVVVRFRSKGDTANWAIEFLRDVDLELGQRSIEQNEFLDTILTNDTDGLRKPLEEEQDGTKAPPSIAVTSKASGPSAQEPSPQPTPSRAGPEHPTKAPSSMDQRQAEPSKPTSQLKSRRTLTKSRFRGFDDFEDQKPPRPPSPIEEEPEPEPGRHQADPSNDMQVDSQPLFVTEAPSSDKSVTSRKRAAPSHSQTAANMLDGILPGAAAMKKRRLERGDDQEIRRSTSRPPSADLAELKAGTASKLKKEKEVDFRTAARSYAEDLDRKRLGSFSQTASNKKERKEGVRDFGSSGEEAYGDGRGEANVSELRNLAIIEEMEVKPRNAAAGRHRLRTNHTDNNHEEQEGGTRNHGERRREWDPSWDARRNFKGFRRRGEPTGNRGHKVIVPVEETRLKGFGIGEPYWLESGEKQRRGRKKMGDEEEGFSQCQLQDQRRHAGGGDSDDDDDDDDGDEDLIAEEIAGDPSVLEGGARRATREVKSQTARATAPAIGRKRGMEETAGDNGPAKRLRQSRLALRRSEEDVDDESSSDEDEFKFRRRKR